MKSTIIGVLAGGLFATTMPAQIIFNPNILVACPWDVTASTILSQGSLVSQGAGKFDQFVMVTNSSGSPMNGPVHLVLEQVSPRTTLDNRTGLTRCASTTDKITKSFITLPVGADNVWSPGETLSVTLKIVAEPGIAITYKPVIRAGGQLFKRPVEGDYDGDGRSDIAEYNMQDGKFWYRKSSDQQLVFVQLPYAANDVHPVKGDFDGDGKADPAQYRRQTSNWAIYLSSLGAVLEFSVDGIADGQKTALIVADFDGDGKSDPAHYDFMTKTFRWRASSDGLTKTAVAPTNTSDYPAPASYSGSTKANLGTFQQGMLKYTLKLGNNVSTVTLTNGQGTGFAIPQTGDIDGDGKADLGMYDQSLKWWHFQLSNGGTRDAFVGTVNGTSPRSVSGDFDGDGKTDLATRTANGAGWKIYLQTLTGSIYTSLGKGHTEAYSMLVLN